MISIQGESTLTQGCSPSPLPFFTSTYSSSRLDYYNHLLPGLPIAYLFSATIHRKQLWPRISRFGMASIAYTVSVNILQYLKIPWIGPNETFQVFSNYTPFFHCVPYASLSGLLQFPHTCFLHSRPVFLLSLSLLKGITCLPLSISD